MKHVKAEREKESDPKRYVVIGDEQSYYEEREDFCGYYHSIEEDRKKQKQWKRNKTSLFVEAIGFYCRSPRNKNIAITFDYYHWYHAGDQDDTLIEKAKTAFDLLKF